MTSTNEHMDEAGGTNPGDDPETNDNHTSSTEGGGRTDTNRRSETAPEGRADALDRLGRQLATDLFAELRPEPGVHDGDPIEDLLRAGEQRLTRHGVQMQVLRTKTASAVVRATPTDPEITDGCAFTKGFLAALPELVNGRSAMVIETACVTAGHDTCLYTLLWDQEDELAEKSAAPQSASSEAADGVTQTIPNDLNGAFVFDQDDDDRSPSPDGFDIDDVALAAWGELEPHPLASPSWNSWLHPANAPAPPDPAILGGPGGWGTPAWRRSRWPGEVDLGDFHSAEPATDHEYAVSSEADAHDRRRRRPRPAWARRRAWLLVLMVATGVVGGYVAARSAGTSYTARAIVVVVPGAGVAPGTAYDPRALAVTDAALIPQDEFVMRQTATALSLPLSQVEASVSASVEPGTAVIFIDYTAPSGFAAVRGAIDVATALVGSAPPSAAIRAHSLAVVSVPAAADETRGLRSLGLPLGAALGLLFGLAAVAIAERVDRRMDGKRDLASACGCQATEEDAPPGGGELARAISRASAGREGVLAVVALSETALAGAEHIAADLRRNWLRNELARRRIKVVPAWGDGACALAEDKGPTVLVAAYGEREATALEMARRLDAIGRAPAWAVLVPSAKVVRRWRHGSTCGDGPRGHSGTRTKPAAGVTSGAAA
jgi:hypothetical protein